jgi:hypothetical protein
MGRARYMQGDLRLRSLPKKEGLQMCIHEHGFIEFIIRGIVESIC